MLHKRARIKLNLKEIKSSQKIKNMRMKLTIEKIKVMRFNIKLKEVAKLMKADYPK
jgi:hypothetical protein